VRLEIGILEEREGDGGWERVDLGGEAGFRRARGRIEVEGEQILVHYACKWARLAIPK
jgi:hypothetical protein